MRSTSQRHAIEPDRSRWKKRALIAVSFLAAVLALAPLALRTAGTWLVVEDPLQPARSIVVVGGHLPFGAMEAAVVYQQGWTREVWLTQGAVHEEDLALARVGVDRTPEHVYSRQVLVALGVPSDAIHLVAGRNRNTADEVRAVARELDTKGGGRVILI